MVREILQPLIHKIPRDRRCKYERDKYQQCKIAVDEVEDTRYGGAQHLAHADLFHLALNNEQHQSIHTKAGDKDSDECEGLDDGSEVLEVPVLLVELLIQEI